MFYIQVIQHHWTKASRGGEGAQRRNALPQTMVSQIRPDTRFAENVIAVQETFSWSEPFAEPSHNLKPIERDEPKPFFKYENGSGFLQFDFSTQNCGVVALREFGNEGFTKKSLEIPLNSWVQILANGRFTDWDEGHWSYKQWILNAIQLDETEDFGNPFLRYPLSFSFDGRRQLR